MSQPHTESRGGRRVVLKPLDDDCLLDGELHPSIRLRLSRVRELPMTTVANLHGVERIDGKAVLIWDYVEGRTSGELSEPERAAIERDVRLVVQTLHSHGIVHGALHSRNIIIDARGGVHLTHVSPLLHNDVERDRSVLDELFAAERPVTPGRKLSQGERGPENGINARALVGAAVVLLIGVIIMVSVIWYSTTNS